jgi:DNA-binding transcriptional LysR family regulator
VLDRRLNHVIAVAHGGSFTKAAEIIGISQSGITKSIADLERELGYSLFYRTAKGAMPTEEGRDFIERATRLLEDARTLLAGTRERNDPYAQSLRIGVCPASIEWLLASPLTTLLSRHPSIRYELVASTFERVIQLLRTGGVDVAFGFEEAFAEWSEVKRERISTMQSVFFVRKGHPILALDKVTNEDLSTYDFAVPSDSRPYGAVFRSLFEDSGQWQRHLHFIDFFPIVMRIVASSDTIGVTTREFAASEKFAATFVSVPGDYILPRSHLCCAIRSRWEPTPAVRAFLRAMREKLPNEI